MLARGGQWEASGANVQQVQRALLVAAKKTLKLIAE